MSIISTPSDVGAMLGFASLIWGDWYAPTVTIWSDFQLFKLWHKHLRHYVWLPSLKLLALFIVIMYTSLHSAMYAFYRNVFTAGGPDWLPQTVILLFLFFLAFTKRWLACYMIGGRTKWSFLLLALAWGTSLPVIVLLGMHNHHQELYCLIPYMLFLVGATALNGLTYYVEQSSDYKSKIPREAWYKETAHYDRTVNGEAGITMVLDGDDL